jgi:hypothetical protein
MRATRVSFATVASLSVTALALALLWIAMRS